MAMNFLNVDWKDAPVNVKALSTVRQGGVSQSPYDDGAGSGGLNLGVHVGDDIQHVTQNRALLRQYLPAEPAWLTQVHGVTVLDAAKVDSAPQADASIAVQPGVVCAIQTADCLPVLFCDLEGRTVGAAHAGWRGLSTGVLENTIEHMRRAGAGEILAWLGPAIGPQHFEVGEDVLEAFTKQDARMMKAFHPVVGVQGKYLADIFALARMVLNAQGVERISGGGRCTFSERHRFYSYRRNKVTGRMASLIWLQ